MMGLKFRVQKYEILGYFLAKNTLTREKDVFLHFLNVRK